MIDRSPHRGPFFGEGRIRYHPPRSLHQLVDNSFPSRPEEQIDAERRRLKPQPVQDEGPALPTAIGLTRESAQETEKKTEVT